MPLPILNAPMAYAWTLVFTVRGTQTFITSKHPEHPDVQQELHRPALALHSSPHISHAINLETDWRQGRLGHTRLEAGEDDLFRAGENLPRLTALHDRTSTPRGIIILLHTISILVCLWICAPRMRTIPNAS